VTDNAGNLRSLTGLAGTGDDLMMGTHVYGGGGLNVVYTPGVIGATALTTGAPSLGNIRAIPFVAPRRPGVTLANIYINVTTGLAGNLRLGLYRRTSESNIYPGSLIYGSGDIDTSAAAVKTSAANKQLNPGEVYWLATNNSNGCTVRCAALAGIETMCGIGPTMPTTPNLPLLAVASAYGALPDPFPAGGAFATAVPFPVLGCSFSA
jgi:hypothetical protein